MLGFFVGVDLGQAWCISPTLLKCFYNTSEILLLYIMYATYTLYIRYKYATYMLYALI